MACQLTAPTTTMKIIARNDEPDSFWQPEPSEADDQQFQCSSLKPCLCGSGLPRQIPGSGKPWSYHALECVAEHCNRRSEGATWAEAVQGWNDSIAIDQCERHSYVRVSECSKDYRCVFRPLRITIADGGLHQVP